MCKEIFGGKRMKIVWYCPKCNWVSVSDSSITHCMETCNCTECSMDLEEHYCRAVGNPIRLAIFKDGKWTRKRK